MMIRRILVRRNTEFWTGEGGICLIEGWAMSGFSQYEIGRKMGVSVKELTMLAGEHEVIRKALEKSRDVVDFEVERALYKKAVGGDVRACSLWLKNRKGDVWMDGRNGKLKVERGKPDGEIDVGDEVERLLDEAVGVARRMLE